MEQSDVVVVGGGHGGAQAAIMLRQLAHKGRITVISDEPELPYERPPLSKEYLAGEKTFDKLLLRPPSFWEERGIEFVLERRATAIDPDGKTVMLSDGRALPYGSLVWAAGGAPRQLSCAGYDLAGVHSVRTRADVLAMMAELDDASRVAVVGGGYIGLEAAAVLSKLGKKVVVLEALERVLARVAGPALSAFYQEEHRSHGVDVRTGVTVECIEERDGRACGVRLSGGEIVPADFVIVGIGILPSVAPLVEAGAEGGNGVVVDEFCRTSLADVYAIGDCAAHANRFAGGAVIRLESVQNANDQASTTAKAIMGVPEPYRATPWFWSNQFDLRLQTVGISTGFDEEVVRGEPASRSFSVIYLKGGRVVALDCVNSTRDYTHGRKLVENGVVATRAKLADTALPLKDLLR